MLYNANKRRISPDPVAGSPCCNCQESNWSRTLRKLQICIFQFALASTVFALSTHIDHTTAADMPEPTGKILLTVSGKITNTNHANGAAFDLMMLEAMQATSFETKTAWTEGLTKFTGVKLYDLLSAVGADPSNIKLTALDGYVYELDRHTDSKYPVIIAYKKDDSYMSVRQLGPLWLMFPFDDHPELNTEENRAASVWQLTHMDLR